MSRIHNESVWTTVVTVQIEDEIDESVWHRIIRECVTFLHDVDRVFSPFRSDSYLTLIDKDSSADITPQKVTKPETFRRHNPFFNNGFTQSSIEAFNLVESFCTSAQWKSNGAFNAWRNNSYDPIGLVKGWAADYVVEILKSYGIQKAFVNAGGDIACITHDAPWRIAIENPSNTMTAIGYLELSSGALCTSGTYNKGNHIQIRNRQSDFIAVSVSGPSAALADAYATGVIADGMVAFDWFTNLGSDWGVIAITADSIFTHNWKLTDDFEFVKAQVVLE